MHIYIWVALIGLRGLLKAKQAKTLGGTWGYVLGVWEKLEGVDGDVYGQDTLYTILD